MSECWKRPLRKWLCSISPSGEQICEAPAHTDLDHSTLLTFFTLVASVCLIRGLPAPEAEMLYMQEVEKMEGYGQETFQAKVGL